MHLLHLNCGVLHVPPGPMASCHCLLLSHNDQRILVDTGIGLQDIARPAARIGEEVIAAAGFQFHDHLTAVRHLERLEYDLASVTDIVLTHADPDHAGGLADFPQARVHISEEEYQNLASGAPRYSQEQFTHQPHWIRYAPTAETWFGLESRPLRGMDGVDVRLIPLFGHTRGHAGVAIRLADRWLLHVGDAYYLRVELATDDHPVSALAALRADDDASRRASLQELRRLSQEHAEEVEMVGYHDFDEFPD